MWPKNATVVGISPKASFMSERLNEHPFTQLGDLEAQSYGWGVVCPGAGLRHFTVGKQTLLQFVLQKKSVPASAVKDALEVRVAELETAQGFAPGKKKRKDLKEQVIDEMLPRAFATKQVVRVWVDGDKHRLVIDSVSRPVLDMIQRLLVQTFGDIGMADVAWPRADVLTAWLGEPPADFTNDDEVTMQWPGENGKTVKYTEADLYSDDVQANLVTGAVVQSLAMTYDGRVSFVMTDNLQIRRIRPLDILSEANNAEKDVDRFQADFMLMTLELGRLIDTLIAEA